ncbi:MAG: nucleotidyltransferase family protein [Vicinamibacterales bacterium]
MIAAIVLAAGLSTRMGGNPKALLAFDDGDSFVTRIIRTFNDAGITDVVVVVGHEGDRVAAAVRTSGLRARVVVNADYPRGQFTSVLAGLAAVDRPDVEAVLLALVDAPLFSVSTVQAVARRFSETHAPIVRAVRGDDHGHPVLISRVLFDDLRRADPAFGAKPIVRGNVSAAGDVPVDDEGAFIDIDTPDDFAALPRLLARLHHR